MNLLSLITDWPCFKPSNSVCDISARDAWNALGDMPKEEAMIAYVEEMKKVRDDGDEEGD